MALGANTLIKNSGILRYTFGIAADGSGGLPGQYPELSGATVVICCLGADAEVTPDSDDHIFGLCPGHVAITGAVGTLFAGSNLAAQDMVVPARRVVSPWESTQGLAPSNAQLDAWVPGGTKVHAYFSASNASADALPLVQWEVTTGRRRRSGAADSDGPLYLASIRVAASKIGTGRLAGVLIVELQHSEHDWPGYVTQDSIFTVTTD